MNFLLILDITLNLKKKWLDKFNNLYALSVSKNRIKKYRLKPF